MAVFEKEYTGKWVEIVPRVMGAALKVAVPAERKEYEFQGIVVNVGVFERGYARCKSAVPIVITTMSDGEKVKVSVLTSDISGNKIIDNFGAGENLLKRYLKALNELLPEV